MDPDARTLLRRVEAALEDSRRVLVSAAQRTRETQQRLLRARDLMREDWFVHLRAALLQKRSDHLLLQTDRTAQRGKPRAPGFPKVILVDRVTVTLPQARLSS